MSGSITAVPWSLADARKRSRRLRLKLNGTALTLTLRRAAEREAQKAAHNHKSGTDQSATNDEEKWDSLRISAPQKLTQTT